MAPESHVENGPRRRAAALSADLERRVLRLVDEAQSIPVTKLRADLEPKLSPEERSLVSLVLYNLINGREAFADSSTRARTPLGLGQSSS